MKRRNFLAGAAATPILLSQAGCTPKPEPVQPPAPPEPGVVVPQNETSPNVSDELVSEFLLASTSELDSEFANDARPDDGKVASYEELLADSSLFANVATLIDDAINGRLTAKEVEDAETVDYYHLVSADSFDTDAAYSENSFALTADLLESICGSNAYPVSGENTVLFGLRGCSLADGSLAQSSGSSIQVRESRVDHWQFRCLIGIWDRATGNIEVFKASTVPNLVNMQTHIQDLAAGSDEAADRGINWSRRGVRCNLKPQGFHTMEVGVHNLWNRNWKKKQPGALRQLWKFPVLRAHHDMNYSFEASWDPLQWRPNMAKSDKVIRYVGDNIHAGINSFNPPFSSAGCHTIKGHFKPKGIEPKGDWADFQSALGVEVVEEIANEKYSSNLDGTEFRYLLTTGREARLHSISAPESEQRTALRRLRFGSTGESVKAMRAALGVTGDSDRFDGATMNELLRWQSIRMPQTDGVFTAKFVGPGANTLLSEWK